MLSALQANNTIDSSIYTVNRGDCSSSNSTVTTPRNSNHTHHIMNHSPALSYGHITVNEPMSPTIINSSLSQLSISGTIQTHHHTTQSPIINKFHQTTPLLSKSVTPKFTNRSVSKSKLLTTNDSEKLLFDDIDNTIYQSNNALHSLQHTPHSIRNRSATQSYSNSPSISRLQNKRNRDSLDKSNRTVLHDISNVGNPVRSATQSYDSALYEISDRENHSINRVQRSEKKLSNIVSKSMIVDSVASTRSNSVADRLSTISSLRSSGTMHSITDDTNESDHDISPSKFSTGILKQSPSQSLFTNPDTLVSPLKPMLHPSTKSSHIYTAQNKLGLTPSPQQLTHRSMSDASPDFKMTSNLSPCQIDSPIDCTSRIKHRQHAMSGLLPPCNIETCNFSDSNDKYSDIPRLHLDDADMSAYQILFPSTYPSDITAITPHNDTCDNTSIRRDSITRDSKRPRSVSAADNSFHIDNVYAHEPHTAMDTVAEEHCNSEYDIISNIQRSVSVDQLSTQLHVVTSRSPPQSSTSTAHTHHHHQRKISVLTQSMNGSLLDHINNATTVPDQSTTPTSHHDSNPICQLPLMKIHSECERISGDTLCRLMSGEYSDKIHHYMIIDCRYNYEYNGGHIRGAVNIQHKHVIQQFYESNRDQLKNIAIIFHCEFSQKRGPDTCKLLRELDRNYNTHILSQYTNLHCPNICVLHDGYKLFHANYPQYCTPNTQLNTLYIPMIDGNYIHQWKQQEDERNASWLHPKKNCHKKLQHRNVQSNTQHSRTLGTNISPIQSNIHTWNTMYTPHDNNNTSRRDECNDDTGDSFIPLNMARRSSVFNNTSISTLDVSKSCDL